MKRHVFALLIALPILLITSGNLFAMDGNMGGPTQDGSADFPWLVEDFNDFQTFISDANYWQSQVYTKLMCDIDLQNQILTAALIAPDTNSTIAYFQGTPFSGVFDGNDHTISNLTIQGPGASDYCLGLFGQIDGAGAEVKNLGVVDVNIVANNGSYYIGGLCGENTGSITNSYTTGVIAGGNGAGGLCGNNYQGYIADSHSTCQVDGGSNCDNLGGLCGYNSGTISICHSTGAIKGKSYLGGLCGRNYSDINNSYAIGIVEGDDYLGGLCGYSKGVVTKSYSTGDVDGGDNSYYIGGLCGRNYGEIEDCYCTGEVAGYGYLGGLCGNNSDGDIRRCYSVGKVTGNNNTGGFCGHNQAGAIFNSFWDTNSSDMDFSDGGQAKDANEMQLINTFLNATWDFDTDDGDEANWYMPMNKPPKLNWQFTISYSGVAETALTIDDHGSTEIEVFSLVNKTSNWTIIGQDSCNWITDIEPANGSSSSPQEKTTVIIDVNTTGLSIGDYTHELTILADNGDNIIVPILLHVHNRVGFKEFAMLAQYWQTIGCDETGPCAEVDWYADGIIDFYDLHQLAISWTGKKVALNSGLIYFIEDFSGDLPADGWDYNSTSNGRIRVVGERLRMDCATDDEDALNEATLHLDLTGQSNVELSFLQAGPGDEIHNLPATFTNSANGDGVAVSPDGINWTTAVNASAMADSGETGRTFTINLDALGLEYTSDFQIKFQQYDNYTWPADGREFDDIRVYKVE